MNIGDYVGGIYKSNTNNKEEWKLTEDKINKITETKRYGRRYFTKSKFRPLDADDIDSNTKAMENCVEKGIILVGEVFGLNDKTRPYAEKWVKWANAHIGEAKSIMDI